MTQSIRWHHLSDSRTVAEHAAERIIDAAGRAITARGRFKLVLAGGGTPLMTYRLLADSGVDFSYWYVFLGDERCLPDASAERNSTMISEAWLGADAPPAEQIFWIPAELGPSSGAQCYEAIVRKALPFDMVLLGMGEDGHTASLFPAHRHDQANLVVPVYDAPKPPPERISLNFSALSQTATLMVLVTGVGKRDALRRWRNGESLPVSALSCASGLDVLVSDDAWGDS